MMEAQAGCLWEMPDGEWRVMAGGVNLSPEHLATDCPMCQEYADGKPLLPPRDTLTDAEVLTALQVLVPPHIIENMRKYGRAKELEQELYIPLSYPLGGAHRFNANILVQREWEEGGTWTGHFAIMGLVAPGPPVTPSAIFYDTDAEYVIDLARKVQAIRAWLGQREVAWWEPCKEKPTSRRAVG